MRLIASSVRRFFNLPVHLRQRVGAFDDAEQGEQVGQRVFQLNGRASTSLPATFSRRVRSSSSLAILK